MKQLSPRAQKIIVAMSQEEARKTGSTELLPEHTLLALLKSGEGLGYQLLQNLRINILTLQLNLEQAIHPRPVNNDFSEVPPSRRLRTLLEVAAIESRSLRNEYIGTEHIVIAAMREENSAAWRFFADAGISLDAVRNEAVNVQKETPSSAANDPLRKKQETVMAGNARNGQDGKKSFLSEFSRDLTAMSRNNELDPVVGREDVIVRVIQILSRRTKNNPILVGEPGVGKTAIVEGLAQKISSGQVPAGLLKKRVLCLDLAAMIAGTKYRGEFEERMKKMMREVKESGDIILFIDELHTIIGAGSPEGTMDASNILKPALSRGEIQIVGATTFREYRKHFEKDSALVRRFQVVKVEEPSIKDSEQILEGLKPKFEEFHGVVYKEDVIPAIVKFSERYIPEKFLPDKAIDILDEAGSAKKIAEEKRPQELADLEKAIEELGNEKAALVANQDYERAAEVRDKVRDMKLKLEEFNEHWKNNTLASKKIVTVEDICQIISRMTGIPANQLDDNETKRLLTMEEEIHRSVIGQDEAVRILASAIRRSRAGVSSSARPMGSFIFLGPTGVGKTELAKTLAKFLFGSEDALIRVDMSDFMEKHNASRLVGAPPGYVGFEEGGVLTEKVRQKPYSVVLLDEIEKAHPDIFNLLLQLLEEGELSDNLGHTVNFRNTVIIMTSNAGAREITNDHRLGFGDSEEKILPYEEMKINAMEELKKIMRPELLNRIDDVVVFQALNKKQVSAILDIQIRELEERLAEQNLKIELTKKARDYLVENGYDPSMGARPMRRLIQNEIEDPLSIVILSGQNNTGIITVDCKKGRLEVK